jgi:putative multiple sugar transport system substrate-binding protein
MKKRFMAFLCMGMLLLGVFAMAGCGQEKNDRQVAIAFANSSDIWKTNGEEMKSQLEKNGYTVDIAYADTPEEQDAQIREMIGRKPACLVVGAVDSTKLTDALEQAKEKKIPVIAFDRLLMGSDAVNYYVSYDSEDVGYAMGEYIEQALGLKQGKGPYQIELFAGDAADNNARFFFGDAIKVLQPYIDNGQLVVPSGETTFDQVKTDGWKPENAQARMEKLLSGPDKDKHIDVILSPNDGVAGGIRKALKAQGVTYMPMITGQDGEKQGIEAVKNGEQAFTILKPSGMLVQKCVRMIKAVIDGTPPDVNNVTTYNNGVKVIPSYLCTPYVVDKSNIDEAQ